MNGMEKILSFRRISLIGPLQQKLGEAEDAGQRSADFMAHVGQELALGTIGGFVRGTKLLHRQAILLLAEPIVVLLDRPRDGFGVGRL